MHLREFQAVRKGQVVAACAALGGGYGAVCGAVCGSIYMHWWVTAVMSWLGPHHERINYVPLVLPWAKSGALAGVFGGGVSALLAMVLGHRFGWLLCGTLVGLTLSAGLMASPYGCSWAPRSPALLTMFAASPVILGGGLGLALDRGLRAGRSCVPGVRTVVSLINAVHPSLPDTERQRIAAEMTPADTPKGRGDEPSPTSLLPAVTRGEE